MFRGEVGDPPRVRPHDTLVVLGEAGRTICQNELDVIATIANSSAGSREGMVWRRNGNEVYTANADSLQSVDFDVGRSPDPIMEIRSNTSSVTAPGLRPKSQSDGRELRREKL